MINPKYKLEAVPIEDEDSNTTLFRCPNCGKEAKIFELVNVQLAYPISNIEIKSQKPIDELTDDDYVIEYDTALFDGDDMAPDIAGYICGECGAMLEYDGKPIISGLQLVKFLNGIRSKK